MVFLRSIKKTMLIIGLTYIATGVLFFLKDEVGFYLIMQVLAGGLGICGLLSMFRYFLIKVSDRVKREDFIVGSLLIALGVYVYLYTHIIIQNFAYFDIFGLMMIVSAFIKLQDFLDTAATGHKKVAVYLLTVFVCLCFGALVIFADFNSNSIKYIIMSVGLVFCGLTDIISNFYLAYCVAQYEKKLAEKNKEKEYEPEPVVEEIPEVEEEIKEEKIEDEENKPLE